MAGLAEIWSPPMFKPKQDLVLGRTKWTMARCLGIPEVVEIQFSRHKASKRISKPNYRRQFLIPYNLRSENDYSLKIEKWPILIDQDQRLRHHERTWPVSYEHWGKCQL